MSRRSALSDDERRELLLQTFLAVQREQRAHGALPTGDRTVLSKLGGVLAWVGALQLGVLVSCFSILLVFVVTRVVLHLDLSRLLLG